MNSFRRPPLDSYNDLAPPSSEAVPSLNPRRLLVIDDSDTARSALCSLLRSVGHEVHSLPSAIGATRVILKLGIELVVADISMPGLSGDKLVGVVRGNSRLTNLPIVLVSAESPEQLERFAQSSGADAVLSKSHFAQELPVVVARLLRSRPLGVRSVGPSA